MRAVLRRSEGEVTPGDGEVTCGDIVVRPGSGEATLGGERIELRPRELQLILTLAGQPDGVIDYRTLLAAWGMEYREDVAALRVNVSRLRAKIESDPSDPRYLRTKRGAGYWLSSRPGGESGARSGT
ncbi:MAG: winged helix-turn-helix domain-containing protein [Chloroflexota bacterium]|nr:winged helix-turn-helix domain-containing protein [Chloroflexota bacterium]MDP6756697.1 winged helix-turn-helix domain-containing protein [Chloroflexota bacterium]